MTRAMFTLVTVFSVSLGFDSEYQLLPRVIDLAVKHYCGVTASVRRLTWRITFGDIVVASDVANDQTRQTAFLQACGIKHRLCRLFLLP